MSLLPARRFKGLLAVLIAVIAVAALPAVPAPGARASAADAGDPLGSELMRLTNLDRAAFGLQPLGADPQLMALARSAPFGCPTNASLSPRGRAQDMADRGYFGHAIPSCPNPAGGNYDMTTLLAPLFGYYTARAENIGSNQGYSGSAASGSYQSGCDVNGANCLGVVTSTANAVAHAQSAFIRSSFHRSTILGSYDRFGCGSAARATSPTTYYFVCLFSKGGPTKLVAQPQPQMPAYSATTYLPVGPLRIVDSRVKRGLAGPLMSGRPRTFPVRGVAGIPSSAVAVTGNLTIVNAKRSGYVTISPIASATPTSSTINFVTGDIRANGVVVPVDPFGRLAAFYYSGTFADSVDVVFDVTGYFAAGTGGDRYVALSPAAPAHVLDTTRGMGSGTLVSQRPATFSVRGTNGIPAGAVAVAGVVTMSGQTEGGYVSVTTVRTSLPATSTVNAPAREMRSNGVILPLAADGTLSVVYRGTTTTATANAAFDVTGYFVAGTAGAVYVPIAPSRLVDSRIDLGLGDPLASGGAATFAVSGRNGVATGSTAVTGNLTATLETGAGRVCLEPAGGSAVPALAFPGLDNRASGLLVPLSSLGQLDARLTSSGAATTTHVVFDVTGYFR